MLKILKTNFFRSGGKKKISFIPEISFHFNFLILIINCQKKTLCFNPLARIK